MNTEEYKRFEYLDGVIRKMCAEEGIYDGDIMWEFCSPERAIEVVSYGLPTNYSAWHHGRDFDKMYSDFRRTGYGLPYEIMWTFKPVPRAVLLKTNPLGLNLLINCHVRGHADFGRNIYSRIADEIADIAEEARLAAVRFDGYRAQYGDKAVDMVIETGAALAKYIGLTHVPGRIHEEKIREQMISEFNVEIKNLESDLDISDEERTKKITLCRRKIDVMEEKTPPRPDYDILGYIIDHAPKRHKPWVRDIWQVQRRQAHHNRHIGMTQLLNEGWASYWHQHLMRRLQKEGYLTDEEFGHFVYFHSQVLSQHFELHPYTTGCAFWEDIEYRWDNGKFGREYFDLDDPAKRKAYRRDGFQGEGRKKMFEIMKNFDDHSVIMNPEYFTDDFIRTQKIFIWGTIENEDGKQKRVIVTREPDRIRTILANQKMLYVIPSIAVIDGNYNKRHELYLRHDFLGMEINPFYELGAMEYLHFAWGRDVHFETCEITKVDSQGNISSYQPVVHRYDGKEHKFDKVKTFKMRT